MSKKQVSATPRPFVERVEFRSVTAGSRAASERKARSEARTRAADPFTPLTPKEAPVTFEGLLQTVYVDPDDADLLRPLHSTGPLRTDCPARLIPRLAAAWPYVRHYSVVNALTFFDNVENVSTRELRDEHDSAFQVWHCRGARTYIRSLSHCERRTSGREQKLVESSFMFHPTSYVFYYIKEKRQCVVAGNHRIAAKKLLAVREHQLKEQGTPTPEDQQPDLRLAVVQLCGNTPPEVVVRISNGASRH